MADNNTAQNLISIQNLINSHDAKLQQLTTELKTEKNMLDNLLDNDKEYAEAAKEASKYAKLKTVAKGKVLEHSEAKAMVEKIKDSQAQAKELKVALSDYLAQYVTLSGSNQFEGLDGVLRQIIYSAKLVRKGD
jgi:hypothetical protein